MKIFCTAIALSALFGTVRSSNEADRSLKWEQAESGANCNVEVKVSCVIYEGEFKDQPCAILESQPCAESRALQVTFKYCNYNSVGVDLMVGKLVPKFHSQEQYGFDTSQMSANSCRTVTRQRTFNSCEVGSSAVGMKLEGWVEDMKDVDTYYCYGYDHLKIKLREPNPTPQAINPSITLSVSSEFESPATSGIYISTDELVVAKTDFDCEKNFKFTYTVLCDNHEDFDKVTLAALIGNDNDDLLMEGGFRDEELVAGTYQVVKYETIDTCEKSGTNIVTQATAVATGFPGLLPGSDSKEDEFLIQNISPDIVQGAEPAIECLYKGEDCATYASLQSDCFTDEVDFEYKVEKKDFGCHHVDIVSIMFDDGNVRVMSLDNEHSCHSREFCHGDVWVLKEKRVLAVCDYTENVPIKIDFTFSTPDTRPTEDDVMFEWSPPEAIKDDPTSSPIRSPDEDTSSPTGSPKKDTPTGSPKKDPSSPTLSPALTDPSPTEEEGKILCTKRATHLYFKYTGSVCKNSDRNLRKKGGSKDTTCNDTNFPPGRGAASITINGQTLLNDNNTAKSFKVGDIILVTGGPTNMEVFVRSSEDADATQLFALHSSCSGDFSTGDEFGSFKLVGFYNTEQYNQGVVKGWVSEIEVSK